MPALLIIVGNDSTQGLQQPGGQGEEQHEWHFFKFFLERAFSTTDMDSVNMVSSKATAIEETANLASWLPRRMGRRTKLLLMLRQSLSRALTAKAEAKKTVTEDRRCSYFNLYYFVL